MPTWSVLTLAAALAVGACGGRREAGPADHRAPGADRGGPADGAAASIAQIGLDVRRPSGTAYVTYAADGAIVGGHVADEAEPFVHEDHGALAPAARDALWAAAAAAVAAPPRTGAPPPDAVVLTVTLADASAVSWWWPFGGQPDDARVRALADLAYAHRLGGW